jgi:glycosyltransferase involved in cell wall biosynthesis
MSVSSVDLVYVLPPPYGGVSMHVRRLRDRLSQKGIECRCYLDPRWHSRADSNGSSVPLLPRPLWKLPVSWSWLLPYGLRHPKSIVHCHYGFYWSGAMLAVRLKKRPVVMTIHDNMSVKKLRELPATERWAARRIMRDPGIRWIAVSEGVRSELWSLGVTPETISVIPAYLPPRVDEKLPSLPVALDTFLSQHNPILSAYGVRLYVDQNGLDLYGFDLCCEAVAELGREYPNIGLVLVIPQCGNDAQDERLLFLIRKLGIASSVIIWREPLPEAWPLWCRSDVYLRPTTTDGDSVAVREALSVGTPVVASDAVERPDGVFLHRSRDRKDLVAAIRLSLAAGHKSPGRQQTQEDNFERILDVYRSVYRSFGH